MFLEDTWQTSITLQLYTDASGLGFGGIFGNKWFYGQWTSDWHSGVSQASTLHGSSFGTSTGGDVQTLMSLSKYLAENVLTVSTWNAYNRAKLMYKIFLSKYFTGAPLFPMSSEHIVLFISCCYQKQLSPQTVTT